MDAIQCVRSEMNFLREQVLASVIVMEEYKYVSVLPETTHQILVTKETVKYLHQD